MIHISKVCLAEAEYKRVYRPLSVSLIPPRSFICIIHQVLPFILKIFLREMTSVTFDHWMSQFYKSIAPESNVTFTTDMRFSSIAYLHFISFNISDNAFKPEVKNYKFNTRSLHCFISGLADCSCLAASTFCANVGCCSSVGVQTSFSKSHPALF